MLYLATIGRVSPDIQNDLVSHFRTKFHLTMTPLAPLEFDPRAFDAQRSQASADQLIQAIRYRYPDVAANPRAVVIGITPFDMFMEAKRQQWSFAFSLRSADRRIAVISYARMDPVTLVGAADYELLKSRLRKMVTKNVGMMYYGLRASANPRSVLFGNILGVDDLDRMTEEFNPR